MVSKAAKAEAKEKAAQAETNEPDTGKAPDAEAPESPAGDSPGAAAPESEGSSAPTPSEEASSTQGPDPEPEGSSTQEPEPSPSVALLSIKHLNERAVLSFPFSLRGTADFVSIKGREYKLLGVQYNPYKLREEFELAPLVVTTEAEIKALLESGWQAES